MADTQGEQGKKGDKGKQGGRGERGKQGIQGETKRLLIMFVLFTAAVVFLGQRFEGLVDEVRTNNYETCRDFKAVIQDLEQTTLDSPNCEKLRP